MFRGSMVALITPMHDDGTVDQSALNQLVEFHIENKTDALVAVGTTGESATLNVEEHCAVIKQVIDQTKGRVPVIAGTGANSTSEAIELTRTAQSLGADGALLVTPYYNKPPQEGLYQHYKAVAEAVAIPQILYNVPGRTACDLLPETVERLADIPNIVGIKEATGSMERMEDIKARCGDRIELYTGDDATTCEFILRGGQGCISVTANVAPLQMHDMIEAALAGDADKARAIDASIEHLHRDLFLESNPIPVKWAMHEMGFCGTGIRLPLVPLAEAYRDSMRASLVKAGVPVVSQS